MTLPAASRALAEALPDARYVEIRRAAHAPFLSHTAEFAGSGDEFPQGRHARGANGAAARMLAPHELRCADLVMTSDDPQPFRLDRPRIRTSFDRASATYEAAAVLQARVADELLSRLEPFNFTPGVILDLGAGTGRMTGELKRRYRRSLVVALDLAPGMLREARRHQHFFRRFERVCADAMRLPFADASVDVVVSSLMLQWCDPPDSAFAEIRRVLKPEGFFAFSTFGPDTLRELRSAWAKPTATLARLQPRQSLHRHARRG